MKKLFMFLALAMALAGAEAPASAELKVMATITDLGAVAAAVAGPDASVDVLCPAGRDPHYLPAKPSLARRLGKADLLVFNGLELEIGWLPLLLEKARNPGLRTGEPGLLDGASALGAEVLDVPRGEIDRGRGDIHPLGNPHYTLDPRRAAAVARLLGERLAEIDPENAAGYRSRAAEFAAEVERRLPLWLEKAAAAAARPMIIYRQHWIYLADWLGLEIVGEIEHRPGIAPSPRHVQDMINLGRERGDAILVCAGWDHPDAVKEIAGRISAPLAVLPGHCERCERADDYFDFIDGICEALAAAAAEEGGSG